ncbi:hypothetical protein SRABI80_04227 [Peribacillus frigoritolerans]|nr:hypothetical protein SRABI80_04227 [Peribacillus frigoritolerans]
MDHFLGYVTQKRKAKDVDWNVGHSLSAGGPPAAHFRLWGLPELAIPAGVSHTRSNQLCLII